MTTSDRSSERVRVLIVDDSALMRKLLGDVLKTAPEIEVVGTARDGAEAIEKTAQLRPDVVTLDVEMPGMSGLEALPLIQAAHDASVIMVSAFTQEGADITLAALERGAIDFFPKPERQQLAHVRESRDVLVAKILSAAHHLPTRKRREPIQGTSTESSIPRFRSRPSPPSSAPSRSGEHDLRAEVEIPQARRPQCIVIGISTGGPQALGQYLAQVTAPTPPILIVQHMPAQFTAVFAQRLDRACSLSVKEAEEGDRLMPNRVLIAPGGRHMAVTGRPPLVRIALSDGAAVSSHKPSVDVLFHSAARVYQGDVAGIIMTGMGRDGVIGCKAILEVGGMTFGQDEASSAVYGMNKAAFLEGGVSFQFSLDQFPALIKKLSPSS
ncbi:protein-glutamate methylesterase/protein-glutamine glutaminase [Tundrisphaera lichenicola]|uniref:protein-glutamate methylesterase/protein-glutamine glutaminase n=1 Tax=Tundrisphaera lichenicola TaxID=2029860 RepID=UPI003EBD85CE